MEGTSNNDDHTGPGVLVLAPWKRGTDQVDAMRKRRVRWKAEEEEAMAATLAQSSRAAGEANEVFQEEQARCGSHSDVAMAAASQKRVREQIRARGAAGVSEEGWEVGVRADRGRDSGKSLRTRQFGITSGTAFEKDTRLPSHHKWYTKRSRWQNAPGKDIARSHPRVGPYDRHTSRGAKMHEAASGIGIEAHTHTRGETVRILSRDEEQPASTSGSCSSSGAPPYV